MKELHWHIPADERSARGEVDLFLNCMTVESGGAVTIIAALQSTVRGTLWRLGATPRLVAELGEFGPQRQPPPVFVAETGLVHCANWEPTSVFTVDADAPSGVYSVRFDTVTEPRRSGEAVFTVVPRSDPDILVVLPVTTWAAYNWWGGRSLYDGDGFNGLPRAYQVSFDRPIKAELSPIWEREQGHPYYTWEHPLVAWIEQQGYDVGYATSFALHDGWLPARKLVVCAGHDEYWSPEMRQTLDRKLDEGLSLFMAGANEMCWSIRLDSSAVGRDRVMTCYKDPWADPLIHSEPHRVTSRWADWPLYQPESDTTGVKFVDWDFSLNRRPGAWIARNTAHPLFRGSGFADGDRVEGIVGDEWDAFDPSSLVASKVQILGECEPLTGANLGPSTGHTVAFRTDAGGLVFATGTTSWCWGLDNGTVGDRATRPEPRLQRLTRNVIDAAVQGVDW